jgi:hypothetical protein
MAKIILTEKQFKSVAKKVISERLGVPDSILESAEVLYGIVTDYLKGLRTKEEGYTLMKDVDLQISDLKVNELVIEIRIEEIDGYNGKAELASMGMANRFRFSDVRMFKVGDKSSKIELSINFIVSEDWEINELYERLTRDKVEVTSILAHELKHYYDKQKKDISLIGDDAQYQAITSSGLNFGIPVISDFMRYTYFIHNAENLVRSTEVASRMSLQNVTKDNFREFLENDIVYKELIDIKNFSFEYLIQRMKSEMDNIDNLLGYARVDYGNMSEDEKIKRVLELVYINLVNGKLDIFDRMISTEQEQNLKMVNKLFGFPIPDFVKQKDKVRNNFYNFVTKYKNNEIQFFVDECERFNYISTKIIKKIGKLYDMAQDKQETNESIINWDLHQRLMEKRYGKMKISTTYKHKKQS